MTVKELIEKLQEYDENTRVTLYDPDTNWLLPLKIEYLPADKPDRECDFVSFTGSYSDEIEGHGPWR